jgi:hypothetical protein
MPKAGPLAEEIAASLEDLTAVLKHTRSVTAALIWRRLRDLEEEVRDRFRKLEAREEERIAAVENAVKTLEERMNLAGVKFREMREDVDQVKNGTQE